MGEAVCVETLADVNVRNENNTGSIAETRTGHQCLEKEKEALFEDMKSEVSNPIVSLRENATGCQDITSQTTEATCSGNSSPVETLSEAGEGERSSDNNVSDVDVPRNVTKPSVSTTHVILEVPKHASSSGIRKITFKFSKKKEDNDVQMNEPIITEECGRNFSSWVDLGTELRESRDIYSCAPNMELKMSKKIVPNYPTNVKKLLSTGILDKARVKYISSSSSVRELEGIINVGGYLCGCSSCNFSRVLSAYEFEQHAGAKTRHPNNHIYLDNGKPIYSIIQELKTAPLCSVDEVLKSVAGSSINEGFFQVWKASLQQSNGITRVHKKCSSKLPYLAQSSICLRSPQIEEDISLTSSSFAYNNLVGYQANMEPIEDKKHSLKRPSSYIASSSATKRRDNDLHRALFMPNGLPDGAELAYYVKGQKLLGGYKQGNGIVCNCCDTEISPSQFEAHAGMAARRQPYRHIYTSNGLTLHDIAISLANGQNITTGVSDDMCSKCGDGGDLIFCQSCPRAFHAACLGLRHAPQGVWHCPDCLLSGQDENLARPIIIRLTRVVKTAEYEGGCVLCRAQDFTSGGVFDDRTVILCDQCDKEFHVGCLRESGLCDLKEFPDKWFCSDDCNMIYMALQDSVANGLQMIPASQLNVINRKHTEKGLSVIEGANNIHWRILMGKSRQDQHLSLLSQAAAIFRECFDPIVAKSGRDLIPVMVFGRNISDQEFQGMYCVLLIVNTVVVSAGLIRIFNKEVAELPLVATSREHQGKGYFQALFSCIERLLCSLNVENLVLPAAEEAESIWTKRFGFRKMSEGRVAKFTREFQLTIFKGTSVLEKEVPQYSSSY